MAAVDPPHSDDPRERELAERGRELVAAAVAETRAPLELRERIESERERRRRPVTRRRWAALLASVTGLAVAAAVAIVVSVGGNAAPSALDAVQVAASAPTLPAPAHDARNPALLQTKIEGLPFPAWDEEFRWRAVGARRDEIAGRPATTVFYDSPVGTRAAYTILGGRALGPPAGARTLRLRGTDFQVLDRDGRRVVVWERNGHTCVMSAPTEVPEARLLDLAAWDGGGKVPF